MLQVVGLVWGYVIQQYSQTVYIVGAGFILAAVVSVAEGFIFNVESIVTSFKALK